MSRSTSIEGGEFPCTHPGCGRAFDKKAGLVMHINRLHSKKIKTPHQGQSRKAVLARKQAYNKRVRAENIARGLTSAGKPRKRRIYRSSLANLNKGGATWSKERRARFERTRRAKNKARSNHAIAPEPEVSFSREIRVPNNYCENCGHDQVPAQLAKGFMSHGDHKHGHGG